MIRRILFTINAIGILLTGCASKPATLNVMTHDAFAVSDAVIKEFEQTNNIKVNFILSGDAGAALNQAILTKSSPVADVLYGVDNTFLSRALQAGIYDPYTSPLLSVIPDKFKLDKTNSALPVDFGDVCINYDKAYFAEKNLSIPQTLDDLLKPEYRGLLVVENPATSSTGLAFLMATIANYGENGYSDYWSKLKNNGVVVVNTWNTAYDTNFSGSAGKGQQPMVVSYATSTAAEVVYSKTPLKESPTASIVGPNTCFRQIEFVGILKGTHQRALAEKFVDFMLNQRFQEDIPLNMYMFPTNSQASIPNEFKLYVQNPEMPASLAPDVIAANRDTWIEQWRKIVLQ
jgi:thiamine transport system substrate-binding protein